MLYSVREISSYCLYHRNRKATGMLNFRKVSKYIHNTFNPLELIHHTMNYYKFAVSYKRNIKCVFDKFNNLFFSFQEFVNESIDFVVNGKNKTTEK